jgi:hypothetical protein
VSTPSRSPEDSSFKETARALFERHLKPLLTPYYLAVAGLLGAATVGFLVLIAVLVIVSTNFSVIGFIE